MAKLCNAAPAFFCAQPGGTGRNFTQAIVTRPLQSLLCHAARASFWLKFVTVAGAKQALTGPSEITIVCNHRQLLAYELSNQRELCRLSGY